MTGGSDGLPRHAALVQHKASLSHLAPDALCIQLTISVPAGVLLNMTGHHNESGKILILAALVNFVLCGVLIPEYGSMGAAIATSVAIVIWNGIMAWSAERRVGIQAYLTFTPPRIVRNP